MSVTSVDIDDQLMQEAREVFGPNATKAAVIRGSLELAIRIKRQQDAVRWLATDDPLSELRDPDVRAAARR